MRQEAKTVNRKVKVLRNPTPTYVSLVEHGAIQEPFKVLKNADPTKGQSMAIRKRDVTTKAEGTNTAVRKIVFDTGKFENIEAVQKYLDENGWKDYTVTEKDSTFIAAGKDVKDDDFVSKSIKTVKMVEDGSVLGYVGTKKDAEDETETADEKTAKSEGKQERAIKMSYWVMYSSDDQSVQGVIKDGMNDGVPPGCQEILQATAYAMANVLKASPTERSSMIKNIGGEFADLINATADLYAGVIAEKAVKTENTKKFAEAFRADLETVLKGKGKPAAGDDADADDKAKAKAKKEADEAAAKAKKAADEAEAAAKAKKDGETTTDATVQAPAPSLEVLAALIGKSIGDAVAPITTSINALAAKVDSVQEVAEDARNKATKAAEEASAVAAQAPTKKAVTEQGSHSNSTEEARKAADVAEKARKANGLKNFGNALGLRV